MTRNAQGLEVMQCEWTALGIKRMIKIDEKTFHDACRKNYGNDDSESKPALS
jgi:hypothetical protein